MSAPIAAGLLAVIATLQPAAAAGPVTTERVSVAADGTQADGQSLLPTTDDTGRYVAFLSEATNLVPGDTNGYADIFLRDTAAGTVELISQGAGGAPANGRAGGPKISADGRFVVYYSTATNVVGDEGGLPTYNVYVLDRAAGTTERVPTGSSGALIADISDDGRYVSFESWSPDLVKNTDGHHVYVYDRQAGTHQLVTRAADGTAAEWGGGSARISGDGRHVAFLSHSADLVAGDTNDEYDVFVRDLREETTVRVSVATDGTQSDGDAAGPSISADGRTVAFPSTASTLAEGDTNGDYDIYVRDLTAGTTTLITPAHDGTSVQFGFSYSPDVSADGRYVAFWSNGWNVVPDDTNGKGDTFVHDRTTGITERVSVTSAGEQAGGADSGVVSADGRVVYYRASATDLVPGDTNGVDDVFRTERG